MLTLLIAFHICGCSASLLRGHISPSDEGGAADQRLQVEALLPGDDCVGGWNAINPSFSLVEGSSDMAVVMRGLCLKKYDGHATWYNQLVIGTMPASDIRSAARGTFNWTSLELGPDLRRVGGNRRVCYIPNLDKAEGPEDPRLVETREGLFAVVTSYEVSTSESDEPKVCTTHGVLLYAARVTSLSPPAFGEPVPLVFDGMGMIEKNWAMFTSGQETGAQVLAVYSVYPHTIARVDLLSGDVEFLATSDAWPVSKLAEQLGKSAEDFHGGAGVARIQNTSRGDYFMSVLHTMVRMRDGSSEYWNFPYTFSQEPPYQILSVGKKLPLTATRNPAYGGHVAFVTTFMMDQGDVFIGYGSGDSSARTFRMPLNQFEEDFLPSHSATRDMDPEDLARVAPWVRLDATAGRCQADALSVCTSDLTPSVCRGC